MRTQTPSPDTLPDNVALSLFRLQDAIQHAAYGGWWAQGRDKHILHPTARAGCTLQYTELASCLYPAALNEAITFRTRMEGTPTIPHTETLDDLEWRRMKRLQEEGLITISGRGGKRTITFNAIHPVVTDRLIALIHACLSHLPKDLDNYYADRVAEQLQYLPIATKAVARRTCFKVEEELSAPEGSLEPIIIR